ncbi:adhesion G-protein coupled receptor G5-like [Symphorus nematophorus]
MEPRLTDNLGVVFVLIILLSTGSSENDLELDFCGTWRHGSGSLSLIVNLSSGCNGISISANESSLSIDGQITAHCRRSDVFSLKQFGLDSAEKETNFCLYWEPLLDQLKLQVGKKNFTLCRPVSVQGSCCTDLSQGANQPEAPYGICNGMVKRDPISDKTLIAYKFNGRYTDCSKGECICSTSAMQDVSAEPTITVQIPPTLKQAENKTTKVLCTFFKNIFLFQEGYKEVRILDDVVEIIVENEVITNLSEPIKIGFHHDVIPKTHSRKCVSWDPRKDPLQVNWLVDGCETHQQGPKYTECLCNHLTYFSVLVQLEPHPVCHLLALTAITSLGCAVSVISSVTLIIFLYRKSRWPKEQSIPIHLGLAVSLAFFSLLFFFTGVLANMVGKSVCALVGAALHYTVLSFFTWMGIEVFHTFWLTYMVLRPPPKPYVWNLVGFVLPAVPVFTLVRVGDIYGVKAVLPCDDTSEPYLMCWMKNTHKALLAQYFTNTTVLAILVSSGIVMLFLLYRKNHNRDKWKQNRVAFLSIWGISILFGATWGLIFLDFGPLSEFVLFLSCILNSFQGFFLMLRFYVLEWMRKQAGGPALGSSSTGSTRQNMLQAQEKS